MKNAKNKFSERWAESYTKRIVTLVLLNSIVWIYCSYILAYLGRIEIAESLSGKVVTTIITTIITYATKSLAEKVLPTDIKKFKRSNGGKDDE